MAGQLGIRHTRRELLGHSAAAALVLGGLAPTAAAASAARGSGPRPAGAGAAVGAAQNILYMNPGSLEAAVAEVPIVAGSPFNTVYLQGITGADALSFAEAADAAGLGVIWDMTSLASGTGTWSVSALDAHPATDGFYISEEPSSRAPVQAIARQLGQVTHPVIGALFAYYPADIPPRLAPLLGICDVISCAVYPIGVQDPLTGAPSLSTSLVGQVAAAMVAAGEAHGFTPALTLQAMSWAQDPTNAPSLDFARWPSRAEMTTMRAQALAGGIRHLFWFSRWAVLNAADPAGRWADLGAAAGD